MTAACISGICSPIWSQLRVSSLGWLHICLRRLRVSYRVHMGHPSTCSSIGGVTCNVWSPSLAFTCNVWSPRYPSFSPFHTLSLCLSDSLSYSLSLTNHVSVCVCVWVCVCLCVCVLSLSRSFSYTHTHTHRCNLWTRRVVHHGAMFPPPSSFLYSASALDREKTSDGNFYQVTAWLLPVSLPGSKDWSFQASLQFSA
jgi:hypothetical protein